MSVVAASVAALVAPRAQKARDTLFNAQNASPTGDVTSIPATFLRVTVAV
jgi:hypothetical protein